MGFLYYQITLNIQYIEISNHITPTIGSTHATFLEVTGHKLPAGLVLGTSDIGYVQDRVILDSFESKLAIEAHKVIEIGSLEIRFS